MMHSRTGLAALCFVGLAACANHRPQEPAPEPPPEPSTFRLFEDEHAGLPAAPAAVQLLPASSTLDSGAEAEAAQAPAPVRRSVSERLAQTTVSRFVVREEASLRAVVDHLRQMTGLPLVVAPAAEDAVYEAGVVFDFQFDNGLAATDLLNLISASTDGAVGWTIKHDAILFTTHPHRQQKMVVHAHDIHDLVLPRTDFKAPRIDRLRLLDELEDEDGGGAFGGSESVTLTTEEEVLTLVQESVAPQTWTLEGVRIDAENGQLIVVHTADVQLRVQKFLDSLR